MVLEGALHHIPGIFGLLLIVTAWQFNDRQKILFMNATAFAFFAVSLFLSGAVVGGAMMLFGAFRTVIANYTQDKKLVALFLMISVAIGVTGYTQWYDALAIVGGCIGILAFNSKSVDTMRILAPMGSIVWAVHNYNAGAWPQLTTDCLVLVSMAIAYIRMNYLAFRVQRRVTAQ
ncbi:MAG: hypothetical protein CMH32_05935 [Micavibrio sp.]|nr:hypothetical protein [Micavibrio sp.]HCK32162.1 hypothetical protein [Rhodospirillaceae bacterium]|tara:strand:+ start:782 stop:1306 length:525 start_codon:yes stop_codon:yes gene_type:complete